MAFQFTSPDFYEFKPGMLFLGESHAGLPLGVKTERHAITFAGARSGKGISQIVQNCRRWTDNLLVIDPKGENLELSWEARRSKGQRVYALDPFRAANVPDDLRASFNPLTDISPTDQRARAKLSAIGNGLVVSHDPKHMEWTKTARSILAGVCGYVISQWNEEHRNFGTVRAILMQADEGPGEGQGLYADAQAMAQSSAFGGLVRNAGVILMRALEDAKSKEASCLSLARESSEWLDDEPIQAALGSSTFNLSELKTGAASVFLVLPADNDYLTTYAGFLRLFVKAALQAMGADGKGSSKGKRCLFLLDEFFSLGKMEELAEAAGRMPSYGVHLWPFMQNLGQLAQLYGSQGAETFFANSDASCFFGISGDIPSCEYVSRRIGVLTPEEITERPPTARALTWGDYGFWDDDNSARDKLNVKQENERRAYEHAMRAVGSPRIPPQEVAGITGRGPTDQHARSMIVFAQGNDVLYLKLRPYWLDPAPKWTPPIAADLPGEQPAPAHPPKKLKVGAALRNDTPARRDAEEIPEPDSAHLAPVETSTKKPLVKGLPGWLDTVLLYLMIAAVIAVMLPLATIAACGALGTPIIAIQTQLGYWPSWVLPLWLVVTQAAISLFDLIVTRSGAKESSSIPGTAQKAAAL